MNFNSLFFPAPAKTYSFLTFYNEIIYIPKTITKNHKATVSYIPCLFLPYKSRRLKILGEMNNIEKVWKCSVTHKIVLYFHGNAEDIGHSYEFLQ
jgi:hypothetical protein